MNNKVLNCAPSDNNGTDWEMPKVGAGALPEEFSRRDKTPKVVNQGSIGSCVGQTARIAFSDTVQCNELDLSAMWIYKAAKRHDYWDGEDYSGTSISGACEALRKEGACLEEFYPYNPRTENVEPLDGAKEDASTRKVLSYYKLTTGRTDEIKEVLMGEPLMISVNIHSQFFDAKETGLVKEEGYTDSKKMGGHAMAVTGWKYIDGELHWECQNSWGVRWGDDGFCYIPDTLLHRIGTSAFYYLVTDGEKNKDLYNRSKYEEMNHLQRFLNSLHSWMRGIFDGILKIFGRK